MNIEVIRLQDGGSGNAWNLNMVEDDWAPHLENLLKTINDAGFKCWFQCLGDPYGAGNVFGVDTVSVILGNREPALWDRHGHSTPLTVSSFKAIIDALAGNNSLNHNFLTDPRIIGWALDNENWIGNGVEGNITLNSFYYFITEIMDYARSLGAKVIANCPMVNYPNWNSLFSYVRPYFDGTIGNKHADYMEFHLYGIWELEHYYPLGNPAEGCNYDWASWKSYIQNFLQSQINNRGNFTADEILIGEFGISHGQDVTAYFTSQNVIDYFNNYYTATVATGIKRACFETALDASWNYSMISPVGVKQAGWDVIATYYYDDSGSSGGENMQKTFSGSISDQVQAGEKVTVTITKPDGTKETLTAYTETDKTFTTSKNLPAGTYPSALFHIDADTEYSACDFEVKDFVVGLATRTIQGVVT